jgi:hypothetical protein
MSGRRRLLLSSALVTSRKSSYEFDPRRYRWLEGSAWVRSLRPRPVLVGYNVDPLYTSEVIDARIGLPGEFPFTRGVYPAMQYCLPQTELVEFGS